MPTTPARPRDPRTGRFLPAGDDGDDRWNRLFSDRSRDAALAALVAGVEADVAAGRTLDLGWDEIDQERSEAPARPL